MTHPNAPIVLQYEIRLKTQRTALTNIGIELIDKNRRISELQKQVNEFPEVTKILMAKDAEITRANELLKEARDTLISCKVIADITLSKLNEYLKEV